MTVTYMLELTEEELTVIHCLLLFMNSQPMPMPFLPKYDRVDTTFKTAGEKVERLMEGR